MYNLSKFNLTIGSGLNEVDDWFQPVWKRGRGAAFIDTGFIKALLDDKDQYATPARRFFASVKDNFYTTNLVLTEVVRQIAKDRGVDFPTRTAWFDKCSEIIINTEQILVCAPSRDVILDAYRELRTARLTQPTLDLCDIVSVAVLTHAQHRRVFGFDAHFRNFGAQLEPLG